MKVFVSWSGQRSKAVAELISDWIKCVLQASHPWISTRDIDKGAIWFSEISDQLKDTAAGIVCLTQENKNKPWILFETGALAKGLSTNRVCTFLIDLNPSDIEDPLAQFNHTMPERTSMWGLTCSLNNCLELNRLDERILRQVFETYWPQFEAKFAKALEDNQPVEEVVPRSDASILSEILANTRSLSSRIRDLESKSEMDASALESSELESIILNLAKRGDDIPSIALQVKRYGVGEREIWGVLTKNNGRIPPPPPLPIPPPPPPPPPPYPSKPSKKA
ncbi:TIR domain-containing protein [Pseudomonas sp. ACN5]|uniref:TIR domain-containing protein n=1 Tax=Pseudomonas sp. ACN5 TaxID=1920427 RepID=UPI000BB38F31|nr:TIR domain-containing protein [Pseudomonas sp. ACN5]PBJ02051.1 hypothetical protein BSF40_51500 [Pseudomonas sp. ACN5]